MCIFIILLVYVFHETTCISQAFKWTIFLLHLYFIFSLIVFEIEGVTMKIPQDHFNTNTISIL